MNAKCNGRLLDKKGLLLGSIHNDIGQDINIDFLNKIQEIPFCINTEVFEFIQDTPTAPKEDASWYDIKMQEKAFKQFSEETDGVINYLLENDNKFWFTWAYDARGRSYSQGYHLNLQANSYRKAMIDFHRKEVLTAEGVKWLKIDIANTFGLDKEVWFKRLLEANKILKDIFADLQSWKHKTKEYAKLADSPNLFSKAILAYYQGVIKGEPIGYMASLDSTASGKLPSLVVILS